MQQMLIIKVSVFLLAISYIFSKVTYCKLAWSWRCALTYVAFHKFSHKLQHDLCTNQANRNHKESMIRLGRRGNSWQHVSFFSVLCVTAVKTWLVTISAMTLVCCDLVKVLPSLQLQSLSCNKWNAALLLHIHIFIFKGRTAAFPSMKYWQWRSGSFIWNHLLMLRHGLCNFYLFIFFIFFFHFFKVSSIAPVSG